MKIKIKRIICLIIATVILCSPMENVTWCNNNVYADTISRNAIDEISTMKTREEKDCIQETGKPLHISQLLKQLQVIENSC